MLWFLQRLHQEPPVGQSTLFCLIKDVTLSGWTQDREKLFKSIKDRISEDTILAVPSTDYVFHSHVDSSNVGTGCILMQQFPEGKRFFSFKSRIFDKADQKTSTLHRKSCGLVSTWPTYDHYIFGCHFQYNCTVITNRFYTGGGVKNNYHIAPLDTK